MREVSIQTFVTLDGVMQAPGGPEEDRSGDFRYGGWSVTAWDETMVRAMEAEERKPCDFLLGRKTFEIFAAHWPHVEDSMAEKLTSSTKYVVSNTLDRSDWANTVFLDGGAEERVRELKQRAGPELRVVGSWQLIQALGAAGLVDEYRLWVFPVVVGEGKRVFGDDVASAGLELIASTVSTTGVLMTTYRKKGPVEIGSFALEDPTEAEIRRRESIGD